MSEETSGEAQVLAATERVVDILAREGTEAALIGAVALAVYRYPRSTEDVDLAVGVDPHRLGELALALEREGFVTSVSAPDAADPLGGVVRVQVPEGGRVEIVNFCNPPGGGFPALIEAALRESRPVVAGAQLRVVTLPQLSCSSCMPWARSQRTTCSSSSAGTPMWT
ncbi:MAG: hypothetical protein EOO70_04470 [Myxococcaceae bacterium]|nr:MAG: hypothetical protein EOO70_04470 [Myxococcaceae bacterium]